MDAYALVGLCLGLGLAARRWRLLPDDAADTLNGVVLQVCLPAAVLRSVPRLDLDPRVAAVAAVPWALALGIGAVAAAAARALALPRDATAVLVLCAALGNTSFVGFPLVRALLGEDALPYAVVYDQLGSFLLVSTLGLAVVARAADGGAPDAAQVARRLLRFPPAWALALGLTVVPARLPGWVSGPLDRLADAMVPLAMLAVGMGLELRVPREHAAPFALGLALKLLAMPAVGHLLARALGLSGDALQAVVLEAAMPPMITAGALASARHLAPGLAAGLVGYGLLLGLVTVPAWALWLRAG